MPLPLMNLQYEADIALRYGPFVEAVLDCKIASLAALDLLLIQKDILNDEWFFKRKLARREQFLAEHPEIQGAQRQLVEVKYDFAMTVAQEMTREEKVALRERVVARSQLKIS